MKQAILFLVLAGYFASCSRLVSGPATKLYADPKLGFRFRYPKDWQKAPAGGATVVMFSGGGTNRQISVSHEAGSEKEIADKIRQFGRAMPDCKELKGGWLEVKGRRAYFQIVTWSSPLGENKAIRLYVPKGEHFFVITGLTPLKEFDRYASTIEECILSFEVMDGE